MFEFKKGSDYDTDLRKLPRVFSEEHKEKLRVAVLNRKGTRVFEGKSMSEWSEELGVNRRRLVAFFDEHGTIYGCKPGKAGGWNAGKKVGPRSQESIVKQLATRATRTYTAWNKGLDYWTDEMKAKQSDVAKRVNADPEKKKAQAKLMSENMKKSWASGKRDTSKQGKRKPVMTPYGEFPSASQAAKEIAPQLGVKPATIYSYILRKNAKNSKANYTDWYYIEETA